MSDTPQTDELEREMGDGWGGAIEPLALCRELERKVLGLTEALAIANRSADEQMRYKREAEAKLRKAQDHLELAWGVIANAGHRQGGWGTQDKEWVEAAERWRDTWHEMISVNESR